MSDTTSSNPVLTQPSKKKARIRLRGHRNPQNPNRRNMSVNVTSTFDEVHEMNKKALNILAKRA